jgi:hypothetical protein
MANASDQVRMKLEQDATWASSYGWHILGAYCGLYWLARKPDEDE